MPLGRALDRRIGDTVKFTVKEGEVSLNEYSAHPNHRVQGVPMIHKGRIVYEVHPGINPMDRHVWMSPGKATVGLVLAMLEDEGKINLAKPVVDYASELRGTDWDEVRLIDAANMSTGLALEETLQSIVDPGSIIVRFFSAEFGAPSPATGRQDRELARRAETGAEARRRDAGPGVPLFVGGHPGQRVDSGEDRLDNSLSASPILMLLCIMFDEASDENNCHH